MSLFKKKYRSNSDKSNLPASARRTSFFSLKALAWQAALALLLASLNVSALDWRGNVSTELTWFPEYSTNNKNWKLNTSVAAEVELTHDLTDNIRLTVHPFGRLDKQDKERSRAGFRELLLSTSGDTWDVNAGLGRVFWGVTESRNPVDIINQIDAVDDLAGDEKLGQLMLNLNWFTDYGDFETYLLPQFHERTVAGSNGRPYTGITIDPDLTSYESDKGSRNIDLALRWTYSFDAWDVGLHYFDGTAREPALTPVVVDSSVVLAPRYSLIQQAGVDAQGLYGDLAIKTELVFQRGDEIQRHAQAVTGIEYTLVGVLSSLQENDTLPEEWCVPDTRNVFKMLVCNDRMDLGLVVEYLWDERGDTSTQPFQNDLLTGLRFAFNDAASSDALLGLIQDFDGGATTLSFETSTRLFESYRLKIVARHFMNTDKDRFLNVFENESFLQLDFSYFF